MRSYFSPSISKFNSLANITFVSVIFFIYWPGLSGSFIYDDIWNITRNPRIYLDTINFRQLQELWFSPMGTGFNRPLSFISFALNYWATGLDPWYFKLTSIIIHCCNTILVYYLGLHVFSTFLESNKTIPPKQAFLIPDSHFYAFICALLWGVLPINVSSVLYIVQRMTELSTLFTLLCILIYCRIRQNTTTRLNLFNNLFFFIIFLVSGLLSKQNACLTILYCLSIEICMFRWKTNHPLNKKFLIFFYSIFLILPAVSVIIYTFIHPSWVLDSYTHRNFNLTQRLLSGPRILFNYLHWIVFPSVQNLSLFHDDIAPSISLFNPISTLFSLLAGLVIIVFSFIKRKALPYLFFGVLWFISGHALESSFVALELVFEHRNYLASWGIIASILLIIRTITIHFKKPYLSYLIAIPLLYYPITTYIRTNQWGNFYTHASMEALYHPESARAHNFYASFLLDNTDVTKTYAEIVQHYKIALDLDSASIIGYSNLITVSFLANQPIKQEWLDDLKYRLRYEHPRFSNPNALIGLITFCRKHDCAKQISKNDMLELFNEGLKNPFLLPQEKSAYLNLKAIVIWDHWHDFEIAKDILEKSIQLQPKNFHAQQILFDILISANKLDEAKNYLQKLNNSPFRHTDSYELQLIEKKYLAKTNQPLS